MDAVNFVFTFGVSGMVLWSLGSRFVAAHRHQRRSARRRPVVAPRRSRPALPIYRIMSRPETPDLRTPAIVGEQHSYAAERSTEQPGTAIGNTVPALREQVGTLSDDDLLRELALVVNEDGSFKYADSRIAKFIGGRTEDRIAQVRAVRGVVTPPRLALPKNYPLRTAEQETLRMQLGIGKRGAP